MTLGSLRGSSLRNASLAYDRKKIGHFPLSAHSTTMTMSSHGGAKVSNSVLYLCGKGTDTVLLKLDTDFCPSKTKTGYVM